MTTLQIARYLDALLRTSEIKDYSNAVNGLQVENGGAVTRIAAAVDACETTLKMAAEQKADLLLAHHGLFWSGLGPITGASYRKLRLAMDHGIAVYSSHLPLDVHPEFGNNALLCRALGFPEERLPLLEIGWKVEGEWDRETMRKRLEEAVGGAVHLAPGGPTVIRRVGVVTGGAGGEVFKAAVAGVDTFITGEGPHWSFTAAEESGVNLFYAGHYATETFGVKALAAHLSAKLDVPWVFLDHPTGL